MEVATVIVQAIIAVTDLMNQAQRVNCWTTVLSKELSPKQSPRSQPQVRRQDAFDRFQNAYSPSFTLQTDKEVRKQ
jgi:hypothetical protein